MSSTMAAMHALGAMAVIPRRLAPALTPSSGRVKQAAAPQATGERPDPSRTSQAASQAKRSASPQEDTFQARDPAQASASDAAFAEVLQKQKHYQELGRREGAWRKFDRGSNPLDSDSQAVQEERSSANEGSTGPSGVSKGAVGGARGGSARSRERSGSGMGKISGSASGVSSHPNRGLGSSAEEPMGLSGQTHSFAEDFAMGSIEEGRSRAGSADDGSMQGLSEDRRFVEIAEDPLGLIGAEEANQARAQERSAAEMDSRQARESELQDSRFAEIAKDPLGLMKSGDSDAPAIQDSRFAEIADDPFGLARSSSDSDIPHQETPMEQMAKDPLGLMGSRDQGEDFSFGMEEALRELAEDPFGLLRAMQDRFDPAAQGHGEQAGSNATNLSDPRLVQRQEEAKRLLPSINVGALGDPRRATSAYQRQLPQNINGPTVDAGEMRFRAEVV